MRFLHPKSYLVLAFALIPVPAMAGFEFTPTVPQETVSRAPEMSAPAPMQDHRDMNAVSMPVAAVDAVPLAPAAPMMQAEPAQVALPKPMRTKTSGLYIDPYPLQSQDTGTIDHNRIEQALAEKAGGMHPVQLGGGMTTGANAKGNTIVASRARIETKSIEPIAASALTPMMGDEPAPLPGYGLGKVERQEMRQFAQAVGFGKGLPLALAISQVVPSEFTHRFDGDVDASLMVDWEGGKPWNLVLNDMLREHNMRAEIDGNVVVIKETAKI